MRLSADTLNQVGPSVRRPAYDIRALKTGILHLGLGAFHRAHQAVFTDDAIEAEGGAWGITGVSMRSPTAAETLGAQDGLFTVETLVDPPRYRIIGAERRTLCAPLQRELVLDAAADCAVHIISLTVTEKGYCLRGDDLDFNHPDIVHDLANPDGPRSAVGILVAGLERRRSGAGTPLTIISCDNLADNGRRLAAATVALADRLHPGLAGWIEANAAFPETMVDSIVPASDSISLTRTAAAIGMVDLGAVQRETFAQWVIEDRFAGPRPAWNRVGVELVQSAQTYRQLKLHVLNASHSALAYLGLGRGFEFVRQAVIDPDLSAFLDGLVLEEVAAALPGLPVPDYWVQTKPRFANPMLDHRLSQVGEDGAAKLSQRIFPLLIANLRSGRPAGRMAAVVRAWMKRQPQNPTALLDDPAVFPDAFRTDPSVRSLVLEGGA
jgi:fructuronate reductase